MKKYLIGLLVFGLLVAGVSVASAQSDQSTAAIIERLQAQIKQLIAQIEELKAKLSGQTDTRPAGWPYPGNSCFGLSHNLKPGEKSEEVKKVQKFLKEEGHFPVAVDASGYYGEVTTAAVKKFQLKEKLIVSDDAGTTTVIGPKTRERIEAIYCGKLVSRSFSSNISSTSYCNSNICFFKCRCIIYSISCHGNNVSLFLKYCYLGQNLGGTLYFYFLLWLIKQWSLLSKLPRRKVL